MWCRSRSRRRRRPPWPAAVPKHRNNHTNQHYFHHTKKWSKGRVMETLANMVIFGKATDGEGPEGQAHRALRGERLKITGCVARAAMRHLVEKSLITSPTRARRTPPSSSTRVRSAARASERDRPAWFTGPIRAHGEGQRRMTPPTQKETIKRVSSALTCHHARRPSPTLVARHRRFYRQGQWRCAVPAPLAVTSDLTKGAARQARHPRAPLDSSVRRIRGCDISEMSEALGQNFPNFAPPQPRRAVL